MLQRHYYYKPAFITAPCVCVADVRPEDLEDEVISAQPQTSYQAVTDTAQADVVSVEIDAPVTTDKSPIAEADRQAITDDEATAPKPDSRTSSGEETPPLEDQSRNLIPTEQQEPAGNAN